MTTPSNPLAGVWGIPRDHGLGSRQARRISRRFADVGVGIPPGRLREIAAGAPCRSQELTDLNFALVAIGIQHDEQAARFRRTRRRGVQWVIVVAMVLVLLNVLICMAFAVFSLAGQASPY